MRNKDDRCLNAILASVLRVGWGDILYLLCRHGNIDNSMKIRAGLYILFVIIHCGAWSLELVLGKREAGSLGMNTFQP